MSEKIREQSLRRFRHVCRSEGKGLCKRVMRVQVGKQSRGRPKRRSMDCVQEEL